MTDEQCCMTIPAEDLKAVLPFKADQDVRYYLNGVYVEKAETGGCILVATNGHLLAALHSPGAYIDQTRILKVSDGLSKALRESTDCQRTLELVGEKGYVTLNSPIRKLFIQPDEPFIEGKYPEWRRVVPAVDKLEWSLTAPLSAEYLATLKRAVPPADRRKAIIFYHQKADPKTGAMVARLEASPGLIVVIMPMEIRQQLPEWPSWMKRESSAETAAPEVTAAAAGGNQ